MSRTVTLAKIVISLSQISAFFSAISFTFMLYCKILTVFHTNNSLFYHNFTDLLTWFIKRVVEEYSIYDVYRFLSNIPVQEQHM